MGVYCQELPALAMRLALAVTKKRLLVTVAGMRQMPISGTLPMQISLTVIVPEWPVRQFETL